MKRMIDRKFDDVISKIPEYFYPAFSGELVSVFGPNILTKSDVGDSQLLDVSGTNGWNYALKMACHKLNLNWLLNWYDELKWYDSDDFDYKLVELIFYKFLNAESQTANPYYLWLIDNKVEP